MSVCLHARCMQSNGPVSNMIDNYGNLLSPLVVPAEGDVFELTWKRATFFVTGVVIRSGAVVSSGNFTTWNTDLNRIDLKSTANDTLNLT